MPEFISVKTRADAVKAAQTHLKNKPTLSGGNYYQLPDGTKLRVRKKEGGRLSAENYETKQAADIKRSTVEKQFTTEEEKANYNEIKRQTRQESQSTLALHSSGGRVSIVEHNVSLRAGGSNQSVSKSDPFFKDFKDAVESKIYSRYGYPPEGGKYTVDINDVTGYLRIIPTKSHNTYQPTSSQPGFDFEPGMDIDEAVKNLPIVTAAEPPPQTSAPQGTAPRLPTTTQQKPTVLPKAKPAPKATVPVKPRVTPKQDLSVPVMPSKSDLTFDLDVSKSRVPTITPQTIMTGLTGAAMGIIHFIANPVTSRR